MSWLGLSVVLVRDSSCQKYWDLGQCKCCSVVLTGLYLSTPLELTERMSRSSEVLFLRNM